MYAKIFKQIYDSSLAENYQHRHIFMDMLVLADSDGVVDMTHEAISRRINVPIDLLREAITALESPDPRSRSEQAAGARLQRIDDHRDWGWFIVNYSHYRNIAKEDNRREKTKERVQRLRERNGSSHSVTPCNAGVTPCNAVKRTPESSNAAVTKSNDKETDTETDTDTKKEVPPLSPKGGKPLSLLGQEISTWFHRKATTRWSKKELKMLAEIEKEGIDDEEVEMLGRYYKAKDVGDFNIRRRDVKTLLGNWTGEIDRARAWETNPKPAAPPGPTINPVSKKRAIEELLEKHPCNKNSTKHTGKESEEQWADYRKLKADLETVTRAVAMSAYTS